MLLKRSLSDEYTDYFIKFHSIDYSLFCTTLKKKIPKISLIYVANKWFFRPFYRNTTYIKYSN